MRRIRVIPVLLIKDEGLVKTVKFKKPNYVGDPINAVKIFNEKEVDEIVVLDINCSKKNTVPNFELIEEIASEAFMPFSYGGGITAIDQIKKIIYAGAEKVILNTAALASPMLITDAANMLGNQSVVVSVDVKKSLIGKYQIYSVNYSKSSSLKLLDYIKELENLGAGEIFVNSVDRDGTYKGYDIELLKQVAESTSLPVIACGGANSVTDFRIAVNEAKVSAVAAGSMFVYHGKHRAVLINYPDQQKLIEEFYSKIR